MKQPLLTPLSRMVMPNDKTEPSLIVFGPFSLMQVFLYFYTLKLPITLSTPKTATPLVHSPTLHLTKSTLTKSQTSQDFAHLVVKHTSTTIHPSTRSYRLMLTKASSLGMQTHRRPIGYTYQRRGQLSALYM